MKVNTTEALAALEHHGIRTGTHPSHASVAGEEITITGRMDAGDVRVIVLQSATHAAERLVPLGDVGAEMLATTFRGHEHRGTTEQKRRMLEDLLLHLSDFFETAGVSGFVLSVRLHENSYTVAYADVWAPKALHVKPRLAHHAHDGYGQGAQADSVTEPHRRS